MHVTQVQSTLELSTWDLELFALFVTLRSWCLDGFHVKRLFQGLGQNPNLFHALLHYKGLERAPKNEAFSSAGNLFTMLVQSSLLYTWALNFKGRTFILANNFLDGILMDPTWNNYYKPSSHFFKLLVKVPSSLMEVNWECHWDFLFCNSQANGLPWIHWLLSLLCFVSFRASYLTLSMATLHFFKLWRAWGLVNPSIAWG